MLVTYLCWEGVYAIHTVHFPDRYLLQDIEIARIAVVEARIVIMKDLDFSDSFFPKVPPPRMIYLRLGDMRNRDRTALS